MKKLWIWKLIILGILGLSAANLVLNIIHLALNGSTTIFNNG